nr:hypothetical protein [uncultured Prevotella sp.]
MKEGYFFCLRHLGFANVYLDVKPMYADDLWWDIFNLPENKKCPISLRGTGAFSIHAAKIKEYAFLDESTEETNEEELSEKWQNIFCLAVQDIEDFLRNYPNADTFIPNKNSNYDADKLLYFITLLHNGRKNEIVQAIKELKVKGHSCQFYDWASGTDSYDFILKWCENSMN